jgi:predicted enzyme related to lactoylglutathione lyase
MDEGETSMTRNPAIPRVSHVGIGVTDMDRSIGFYECALGFHRAAAVIGGQESARLVGLAGEVRFYSQFMELEGRLVELVRFEQPATRRGPIKQFGQTGLTHLSMRVDDLDATLARVRQFGGTVMEDSFTRVDMADGIKGRIIFCTDPDGTRVELMEFPDTIRFDLPAGG